jgi:alcohol dehydrogenase class IV
MVFKIFAGGYEMRTGDQDIFAFHLPTRIVHGPNSVKETGGEFKNLGAKKALVVTDKGVKTAGLLEGVLESLNKGGIPYALFDEVEEDPGGTTVARGAETALREKCDGIIVLGGGSPICAGRGIGVVATNGGHIKEYAGLNKASKPPLPLIAIPTTAGSGAEVSQFIVLKDEERHTKMVAGSPLYFPKVAILDPMLLRKLSFWQSVVSGVDALSHAIEAYFTAMTTPITDAIALSAIDLIYRNLGAAAASDDLDAKEACLIGSSMANIACGNARLGLTHTLTIPMEGMFKIQHGIAIGVLLPHVMEFNLPASYQRFSILAKTMGEPDSGRSMEEPAPCAIRALKRLYVDLGFPRKYSDSQVDRKAIRQMAGMIMEGLYGKYDPTKEYPANAVIPSANIRKATMKDAMDLYERAFDGWEL